MEALRKIIHEEVKHTLFGQPVPKEGDKDYIPMLHDPQLNFLAASHGRDITHAYESFLQELSIILSRTDEPSEVRLDRIKSLYGKAEQEFSNKKAEHRSLERKHGY